MFNGFRRFGGLLVAVLVVGVLAGGLTAGADSENNRNEVVPLEPVPGLPDQFDNVRGRVQLVAYYDDHQNPAWPEPTYQAWMRLTQMPCLAQFLDAGQWTYAFWVETPSNGLVRLFNFHANCFNGTAAQDAIGPIANAALDTMLEETIRFRVTVENVVGGTEFPNGEIILEGGVDRGLVVECGNPPPETLVIDELVLDAGESFRWTLEVIHENYCFLRYASTGPVFIDGYEQQAYPGPGIRSLDPQIFYCGPGQTESECYPWTGDWVLRTGGLYEIEVSSPVDGNVISIGLTD